MRGFILIFIGGGLGSVFRFLISKYLEISKGSFPWATDSVLLPCLDFYGLSF